MRIAYKNIIDDEDAIVTASSNLTNYDIENIKDQRLSKSWKSDTATTQTVTIELNTYPDLPDDPAGVSFDNSDIVAGSGVSLVVNADGSVSVTTTTADPQVRLSDYTGACKGKVWIFEVDVPAGATLAPEIGYIIYGSSSAGYQQITTLASLGVAALEAGKVNKRSVYIPTNATYTYAFARLDIVNQSGITYTINYSQIGTGAYLSPTLDTSGNGNHLTNTAAVPVDYSGRKWWNCSSAGDKLSRANPLSGTGAFAISFWAYLGAFTGSYDHIIICNWSGTGFGFICFRSNSTNRITVGLSAGSTQYSSSYDYTPGIYHVTFSYNGADALALYINGALISTRTTPAGFTQPVATLYIARGGFKDLISDVYITNQLLSDEQIEDLYANGFSEHLLKKAVAAYSLDYLNNVNTIGILGHNIKNKCTVNVYGNDTNTFTSPSFSTSLTVIEDGLILNFLSSRHCYKYWQFSFSGQKSLEIGRLWLGTYLDISPSSLNDFEVVLKNNDIIDFNMYNEKYSTKGITWRLFKLSFPKTEEAMVSEILSVYDYSGKHSSVIFCNFDTNRDYELVEPCYCSINNNLDFKHSNRLSFEYDLELEEEL